MSRPNVTRFEARSYEMDPYGHLNNAVFVNWMEHGRLCHLRDRGLTYESIPEVHGVRIVVVHQEVTYKREIRVGDAMDLTTTIEKLGNTSFTFAHEFRMPDGSVAGSGRVTMVCTREGASAPIPDALRTALAS